MLTDTQADVFINSFGSTIDPTGHVVPARKDMQSTSTIRMYGGKVDGNTVTFSDGSAVAWMDSVQDWYYA